MAIKLKGGKCIFCGYDKYNGALDFHHIDGITRSWKRVEKELEKCVLVCANCHREIHAGMLQLSEVIQNEKWGELREALNGNPDPSLTKDVKVVRKEQRLRVRSQTNNL